MPAVSSLSTRIAKVYQMATARNQGWRRALWVGAAAVILLGCAVRWSETGQRQWIVPLDDEDSRQYYSSALNLRDCGLYSADPPGPCPLQEPGALRPPLYPAYLRLALGRSSAPRRAWKANLAASLAVLALTAASATALFSPAAGAAAAALVALDPRQNEALRTLDVQAFYSVLVLLVALALLDWARRPRAGAAALAGLLIGVSLCARSALVLFPLFLIALAWPLRRIVPRKVLQCGVFLLCCALPLLPWAGRNLLVLGHFQPLEIQVTRFVIAAGALAEVSRDFTLEILSDRGAQNGVSPGFGDPGLHGSLVAVKDAAVYVLRHPFLYLQACRIRLLDLWGPWLILWPIALWGLHRNRQNLSARVLAALPLYWNIHALIFSHPRHAAPAIPLLCLAAGLAFLGAPVEDRAASRFWSVLPALFLPVFALWTVCAFLLAAEARSLPAGTGAAARALETARQAAGTGRAVESQKILDNLLNERLPAYLRAAAARLYQSLGRPARCADLLEELTSRFPSHASLHNDAAVCSSLAGRPGSALRHAETAVRLAPRLPAAALTLGALREKNGDRRGALKEYEKILSQPPQSLSSRERALITNERLRLQAVVNTP